MTIESCQYEGPLAPAKKFAVDDTADRSKIDFILAMVAIEIILDGCVINFIHLRLIEANLTGVLAFEALPPLDAHIITIVALLIKPFFEIE
jgi:hypothetical protein